MNQTAEAADQLANYLQWLEQDPDNINLLQDAIGAAIDAGKLETADDLLTRYSEKNELTPELLNLAGINALRGNKPDQARQYFEKLLEGGDGGAATRFNLAWSHAILDDRTKALALLDDEMTSNLPQAAALKVQMLHGEGQFEEAMDEAKEMAEIHPDDPGLMAAMSVLALDVEDAALAKACAEKAANHPDAMTTLGTLELGEHQLDVAAKLFEQALNLNNNNPRAWIGQGLVRLSAGDAKQALSDLDKGAEIFGSHLGSWIAAGWAYFINEDIKTSRERFQTALDLDPSFAESQGSLAVLDVIEGDIKSAEKHCETALRLDRQCFSAALAKSLILQSQGDAEKAERIVQMAMNTPIDGSDQTLADNLVKMGSVVPPSSGSVH